MEYHNALPSMIREINSSCVPFSCVMLNKKMIRNVGYLDEDFSPGYGDDDDYCDRARMAGWRTIILLNVIVYHRHGASFKDEFNENELAAMKANSRDLYYAKKNQRRGIR
jgi:GT2 family glycosyltransferase